MRARTVWIFLAVLVCAGVAARLISARRSAQAAPTTTQAALVATVRAARANVAEKISLTGSVRPKNEVDVFPKLGGRVQAVLARVGDRVSTGQPLLVVEHKELAWQARAAEAAVQTARAGLDGASVEYERTAALAASGSAPPAALDGARVRLSMAQAQLAQAEAALGLARVAVQNATVTSPISGVVTRRPVNVGAMVGPQAPVFTVQDTSALKLESAVDAATFARLARGKEATVRVDELPGRSFPARVALLSPALDPITRRAAIELSIENRAGELIPNMFAHAEIVIGAHENVLVVPRTAVLDGPGGPVAFRVSGGRVRLVRLTLGPSDGDRVAVLTGLSEEDEVVASGLANLSDGAPVRTAGAPDPESAAANGQSPRASGATEKLP